MKHLTLKMLLDNALSKEQHKVLVNLALCEQKQWYPKEIGKMQGLQCGHCGHCGQINQSSLSVCLGKLVKKGFLKRTRDGRNMIYEFVDVDLKTAIQEMSSVIN